MNPEYRQEEVLSARELQEKYKKLKEELLKDINSLTQPLGHGTVSEHLEDILVHGLGEKVPANAYAGTKSAVDLTKPDGLLGAYLFSRWNTEDLAVHNPNNLLEEYTELNPAITKERLEEAFQTYKQKRQPEGYPVVLIYDGNDEITVVGTNPNIPSELTFSEPIPTNTLKYVLVPEVRKKEVEAMIEKHQINITILPVEMLET